MKKLLCVILVLIMVLSLCACGQEKPNNDNNANNQTNQNGGIQGEDGNNDPEPSAEELKMMEKYKDIAYSLKNYTGSPDFSYDNGTTWVHGADAVKAIYDDLCELEALDKWYGSAWMPENDPETNWNRSALLSCFSVQKDKLLSQDVVLTTLVAETRDYKNCFTWSYDADGKVTSVRWNTKIYESFIPFVYGLENEVFYDLLLADGAETKGADYIYDEKDVLTQIKVLGYVDDTDDNRANGTTKTQILITLEHDTNGKLSGAKWTEWQGAKGNISFTYDAQGKLTQVVRQSENDTLPYTYRYSYDVNGNLSEIEHERLRKYANYGKDIHVTYTLSTAEDGSVSGKVSNYGVFMVGLARSGKDKDIALSYDAQGRLISAVHGTELTACDEIECSKVEFSWNYGDYYIYTPAK